MLGALPEHPKIEDCVADIETYRLEVFYCGDPRRKIYFYLLEREPVDFWLIRAFTALSMSRKDARSKPVDKQPAAPQPAHP